MNLHVARRATLALVVVGWLPASARAMNLYSVTPGVYRGSTPETAEDFDRLKRMGIKTVLNLRRFDRNAIAREGHALAARGIRYVHVPIRYFPRGDNSIDYAVSVLNDTTLHPVYVHCKHGRDRSGTVVGLYKVRHHGWSADAAYRDMRQYGFNERLGGLRRYYWSAARRAPLRGAGTAIAGRTAPRGTAPAARSRSAGSVAVARPARAKPAPAKSVTVTSAAARPTAVTPSLAKPAPATTAAVSAEVASAAVPPDSRSRTSLTPKALAPSAPIRVKSRFSHREKSVGNALRGVP